MKLSNVLIVGLDHDVQWRDPTGDFLPLLEDRLENFHFEIVAEEANKLPTTVGQRLASRLNKPWLSMDMDELERIKAGIYDELKDRGCWPLMADGDPNGSYAASYIPIADSKREDHWIEQLLRLKVSSAVMICGLMHVSPLAEKLRKLYVLVDPLIVSDQEWYAAKIGTWKIIEEPRGQRRSEFRPAVPLQ